MPSPYMRDVFRAINTHPSLSCIVSYYTGMSRDRDWSEALLESWEEVLPGRVVPGLGASAHFNPTVADSLDNSSDLVVVMDYSAPTAQIAMRKLNRQGRAWIFWGERPGMRSRGSAGKAVRDFLQKPLRHTAGIVGIGTRAVNAYRERFPEKPVFNIPYLCDLIRFADRQKAHTGGEGIIFLFAGQFIERKGVDLLANAFVRLARENASVRLRLAGSGPLEESLRNKLEPFEDRVYFPGFLEGDALVEAFCSADVFVLPSRYDGWGVVVNEALGAGLPLILSHAVGAADDLVETDGNGIVFPSGDEAALYEAMRTLADDKERRHRFGERSKALAKQWTPEEAARRWAEVCAQVL